MGKVNIRKRSRISFVPLGFPFAEEVLRVFPALLDLSVEHITESDKLLRGTKKEEENIYFLLCFQPGSTVVPEDACGISLLQYKTAEQEIWVLSWLTATGK